ncbi:MAG: hypothetical protein V3S72_08905 [Desulfobacterales bacterium]
MYNLSISYYLSILFDVLHEKCGLFRLHDTTYHVLYNNEGKGAYRVGPGISKVVHEPLPQVRVWAFDPGLFAEPLLLL